MAVLYVRELRDAFLSPVVDGYFAAGRAEPGFTGMGNFLGSAAGMTDILMKSEFICSACEDSFNVVKDIRAN